MLLKQYCLISSLFLLTSLSSFSQNDTIKIVDSLDLRTTQYLTPMEYAFMFHEETPWMIKAGIAGNGSGLNKSGFERRIKGGLTVTLNLGDYLNFRNHWFGSLSARYYYDMQRRSRKRNIPFNLSGNYFEVGYGLRSGFLMQANNSSSLLDRYETFKQDNFNIYSVKWGMQRRYLKRGFIDVGLIATYDTGLLDVNTIGFYSEALLGIAFAKDKTTLNKDKLCSFIKCYEAENSVFKLNVTNLLNSGFRSYNTYFSISPDVSHEFKLGRFPFSLSNSIRTTLFANFSSDEVRNSQVSDGVGFAIEYLFEGRYYFNLKNRILKGKTGNGLSADYFSFGLYNYYIDSYKTYSPLRLEIRDDIYHLQPQITIGTQRFVGDHFFYDLGVGFRMKDRLVNQSNGDPNRYELIFTNKVGFRF